MPNWIDISLRTLSVIILVLVFTRVMGKRNIARINSFEFVCYMAIAVISGMISIKLITNLVLGYIALGIWVLSPILLEYLSLKSKTVHDWINGKETVLIKHGKIMEENLMQTRLTGEELLRELRSKNAFNLADVEFALMETTGEINVFLKSDKKPVTAHDLGQKVAPQAEPQAVILDGNILNEPLASLGLNKEWLQIQLESMGISLDNVFLGQVDSSGDLYIDLFDDAVELPQSKMKEAIYANIEKSQASFENFAMETNDAEAKAMYKKNAVKLKQLMERLETYLLR
jgi:uncharacterized membrane protein YcaP (DUF421 family)